MNPLFHSCVDTLFCPSKRDIVKLNWGRGVKRDKRQNWYIHTIQRYSFYDVLKVYWVLQICHYQTNRYIDPYVQHVSHTIGTELKRSQGTTVQEILEGFVWSHNPIGLLSRLLCHPSMFGPLCLHTNGQWQEMDSVTLCDLNPALL